MSENVSLTQEPPTETTSGAASDPAPIAAPVVGAPDHGTASAPALVSAPVWPPEAHALLGLVGRGLAPDADEATRTAARDLWTQCAQSIATAAPMAPAPPAVPPAPARP